MQTKVLSGYCSHQQVNYEHFLFHGHIIHSNLLKCSYIGRVTVTAQVALMHWVREELYLGRVDANMIPIVCLVEMILHLSVMPVKQGHLLCLADLCVRTRTHNHAMNTPTV